jgi:hypothetical protein
VAPTEEPAANEEEAVSPLSSELSPAPEQEENLEDDKRDNAEQATSPVDAVEQAETPNITENVEKAEMTEEKKEDDSTEQPTLENTSPAAIPPQSPRAPSAPDSVPDADSKNASTSDPMTADPTTTDDKPATSKSPAKSPAKSPTPESAPPQEPRGGSLQPPVSNSYPAEAPLTLSKDKGERLLELNVELLKWVHSPFLFEPLLMFARQGMHGIPGTKHSYERIEI